jgi:protein ImuB
MTQTLDELINTGKRLESDRAYLCIYFPHWSIDVTRRLILSSTKSQRGSPHQIIILTTPHAGSSIVARVSQEGLKLGVKPHMSLELARALVPQQGVLFAPFNPIRDTQALHTLAVWCLRYTPLVGLDSELHKAQLRNELVNTSPLNFGIILDLSGTTRLHRDLNLLANDLFKQFKGSARIALAPTIGCAWALSRFNDTALSIYPLKDRIVNKAYKQCESVSHDLIAHLPIEGLRISDHTKRSLHRIGIYRLSELLVIPRHSLNKRFAQEVSVRLSQLLGSVSESLYPVTPEREFVQERLFEPPLFNRRAICIAIEQLFSCLIDELKSSHRAATLFMLTLTDSAHSTIRREIRLAAATDDKRHLNSVIAPIIESLRFCGELLKLRLEARYILSTHSEQLSIDRTYNQDDETAVKRAYGELLNSFSVRLGKERVAYAVLTNSNLPERGFRFSSALSYQDNTRRAGYLNFAGSNQGELYQSSPSYGSLERPPVLLSPPEPIRVISMLPDRPPSLIWWRNNRLAITSGFGPERISPEWWNGELTRATGSSITTSERDYFRVQDRAGRWLWVFRDQYSQEWFIHGVWT